MNVGTNAGIHEYQSGSPRIAVLDGRYRCGLNSSWILSRRDALD